MNRPGASDGPAKLTALLVKVSHHDKDERYMAILDIQNELLKDLKLEAALEKKLCSAILDRIETDSSNDVQAISVKCLSVLVKKAQEVQVVEVTARLCRQILEGSAELRDVYGIGMKTLVADADERHGRAVAETAAPFLLRGLGPGAAADVRGEALDLATELVRRFGGLPEVAARLHAPMLSAFVTQLAGPTPLIRKRATAAVGALAPVLSDALLEALVSALLAGIEGGGGRAAGRSELAVAAAAASARTLIQCTCTVARHVGSRLGRHLPRVVPILLGQLGSPDDEALASEAGAELRDNCLSAFESILPHCPGRAAPFVPAIASAAQVFARFDPNYAYGGDEDEDAGGDGGDDEDDDAGGYGDEDDPSWKVRRSALRVLHAVVASGRRGGGAALLPSLGPLLVGCLREREEAVRLEAVAAVAALVQASVAPQAGGWEPRTGGAADLFAPLGAAPQRADASGGLTTDSGAGGGNFGAAFGELLDAATLGLGASALVPHEVLHAATAGSGAAALADVDMAAAGDAPAAAPAPQPLPAAGQGLLALVPALLRAVLSLLGGRKGAATVKTRVAVLSLLRSAAVALCLTGDPHAAGAAALRPSLALLLRALVDAAKERGHSQATGVRQQAAATLHVLLLVFSASPGDIAAHAGLLVAPVVAAVRDEYYKITAQGLLSAAVLVTALRPATSASSLGSVCVPAADFAAYSTTLLEAVAARFEVQDVDQDVKEAAVVAVAALLAHAGDVPAVASAVPALLRVLTSRLRSETTRMTALRAFAYVAASPIRVDLAPVLAPIFAELAACLRQQARALRVQALHTLCALAASQQGSCTAAALQPVLAEMADGPSAPLSDSDLQLTRAALDTATALLRLRSEGVVVALAATVLPRTLSLASSPVIQGAAQASLLRFFDVAVSADKLSTVAPGFSFETMLGGLLDSVAARIGAAAIASATAAPGSALLRSVQNTARCVAVLCGSAAAPLESVRAAALRFLLEGSGAAPTRGPAFRALALYALGEVGRHTDVPALLAAPIPPAAGAKRRKSDGAATAPPVPGALMAIFGDGAEDLRTAAAVALGGVAVGSPGAALPAVLAALQEAAAAAGSGGVERVYLLMTALREVLLRDASAAGAAALAQALLPALLSPAVAASPDEGIRGAAAECLGRLVEASPLALVPILPALAGSASPAARFTAMASLRFAAGSALAQTALASPFSPGDLAAGPLATWLPAPALRDLVASATTAAAVAGFEGRGSPHVSVLAVLLGCLADADMTVRLAAVNAVTALAHAAPAALRPLLCRVRPDLFKLLKAAEEAAAAASAAAAAAAAAAASGDVAQAAPRSPPGAVPAAAGYASQGVFGALLFHVMVHRDLVVEVDLGPFKHIKDEGLPHRKAALAALETVAGAAALVDCLPTEAMPFLLTAVSDDQPDVRSLCHATLCKLVSFAAAGAGTDTSGPDSGAAMAVEPPEDGCSTGADAWLAAIVASLPALAAALDATVSKVAAAAAAAVGAAGSAGGGGPPVPLDSARSALRVIDALLARLPAAAAPALSGLVHKVETNDVLARLYVTVKADRVAF